MKKKLFLFIIAVLLVSFIGSAGSESSDSQSGTIILNSKSASNSASGDNVIRLNNELIQKINLINNLDETPQNVFEVNESSEKIDSGDSSDVVIRLNQEDGSRDNQQEAKINPDDKVITKNKEEYIIRDGEEYLLSASGYYLQFTSLPSSICNNEKYDVKVKGNLKLSLTQNEASKCFVDLLFSPYKHWVSFELYLMEDDFVGDDQIAKLYTWEYTYDCVSVYFSERVFKDADLGYYVVGDLGDYGEVYAKAGGNVVATSTSTYDIRGYNTCDCLSGSCCNLASRPYKFKSSGSQPTGYTDSYYCDATNSPTGTNNVIKTDWYCNGLSSSAKYSDSTADTCGTCEYCTAGDSTCNYYSSSTKCGAQDCDYKDTACRDYHDVDRYCSGTGSCSSASCNDYTDKSKGTSCGTGRECDGSGTCKICTSHSYTQCSDKDIYYYDACNNREEKKQECGDGSYTDWWLSSYCIGNDRYVPRTNYDKYCSDNKCQVDSWNENRFVKTCANGCSNGECIVECSSDSDCGASEWLYFCGSGYDFGQSTDRNSVYKIYEQRRCKYPSSDASYCYSDYLNFALVKKCQTGCTNGQCNEDSCTNECSSGQKRCSGNYKQTCGNYDADACLEWGGDISCEYGCENGNCKSAPPACTPNSKRCNGNKVETCKSDGSGWQTTENCGKTKYCSASSCQSCSSGKANCNQNPSDACEINLLTDNNNCGACENKCSSGKICQNGQCISSITCSGTDRSCGISPNCVDCNNNDGCSGDSYRNYYCKSNSEGCSYTSDNCSDCSCSCGGYNKAETIANGNCNDGRDNDCDGKTDKDDSGCKASCFSNNDCLIEEFCKFGTGFGLCGGIGVCTGKPPVCPLLFDPVCGCDSKTYSNDCVAHMTGVNIKYKGECCQNECTSGQKRCSGNYKQTCGNYDADVCLEWPASTSGSGNENCGNNYCLSWGGNYCENGKVYRSRICHDKGCSLGWCYDNIRIEKELIVNTKIFLKKGNNIFSLPRNQKKTFNQLNTNCKVVIGGGKADLAYYVPSGNDINPSNYVFVGLDKILYPGQGYFVKVENDCYIEMSGETVEKDDVGYIGSGQLKEGWNLIGSLTCQQEFSKGTCKLYDDGLGILKYGYNVNSCQDVVGYNGGYEYCSIEQGVRRCRCEVNNFEPGFGYWIKTGNNCILK